MVIEHNFLSTLSHKLRKEEKEEALPSGWVSLSESLKTGCLFRHLFHGCSID